MSTLAAITEGPTRPVGGADPWREFFGRRYDFVVRRARGLMAKEQIEGLLDAHALAHEAYLRVEGSGVPCGAGDAYVAGAIHIAMRRVLIDAARHRNRRKRGSETTQACPSELEFVTAEPQCPDIDGLQDLTCALEDMRDRYRRMHRVVELRFLQGMSVARTASAIEQSARTVKRDSVRAREWLRRRLDGECGAVEQAE